MDAPRILEQYKEEWTYGDEHIQLYSDLIDMSAYRVPKWRLTINLNIVAYEGLESSASYGKNYILKFIETGHQIEVKILEEKLNNLFYSKRFSRKDLEEKPLKYWIKLSLKYFLDTEKKFLRTENNYDNSLTRLRILAMEYSDYKPKLIDRTRWSYNKIFANM
jgi:hypothetical protein